VSPNGRIIAVPRRRQPVQPIAENAEPFPASDDDGDMEDEPSAQPGVSSSAPALHADAYNAMQSNLLQAQEYIALALSSLRLTDITTYGESRCRIPTTIRDLNSYRAATNTEMKALHKKLGSLSTQLTKTLDKHTKVAQRGYIQRVGGADILSRQRQQDEINQLRANINRQREETRRQQQQLAEQEEQLRRRSARR